MSTVSLTSSTPAGLKVDALVVGVAKDPDAKGGHGLSLAAGAEEVDKAFKGRLAETLAGWHWVAFVALMLHRLTRLAVDSS